MDEEKLARHKYCMEMKLKACEERVFLAIFSGSFLYLLFLSHSKTQVCTKKSYDYIQP